MEETWTTSETRPGLFYLEKPQAKKQVNLNTDRTELTELSDNSNSMTEGLVRHKSILLMDIHEKHPVPFGIIAMPHQLSRIKSEKVKAHVQELLHCQRP